MLYFNIKRYFFMRIYDINYIIYIILVYHFVCFFSTALTGKKRKKRSKPYGLFLFGLIFYSQACQGEKILSRFRFSRATLYFILRASETEDAKRFRTSNSPRREDFEQISFLASDAVFHTASE